MPDTEARVEVKCGKCGNTYRVHAPLMMMQVNPAFTQVLIIPSWSIDERICPFCKTMNAPMIGQPKIGWTALEKKSTIAKPSSEEIRHLG